jgi:hypothetical protein
LFDDGEESLREIYVSSLPLNEQKEQQPPAAEAVWRAATKTNRRKKGTGNSHVMGGKVRTVFYN